MMYLVSDMGRKHVLRLNAGWYMLPVADADLGVLVSFADRTATQRFCEAQLPSVHCQPFMRLTCEEFDAMKTRETTIEEWEAAVYHGTECPAGHDLYGIVGQKGGAESINKPEDQPPAKS